MGKIGRRTCRRLGNEATLAHSRVEQAAAACLAVRARYGRKINFQGLRQRAMGRQLLAAPQPPARNIVREGVKIRL